MYLDKYYEMDPNTDDLLFDGTLLRNDMIVVVGDEQFRGDTTAEMTPSNAERIKMFNRWCMVSNLVVGREQIAFIATYDDGTKRKIVCDVRWPWLVKLNSIRPDQQPQDQAFDAFGARHSDIRSIPAAPHDVPLRTFEDVPRPDETAVFQFRPSGQGLSTEETAQGDPDDESWVNDLRRP